MGAQQSTASNDGNSSNAQVKTCYYDVLGVDRQANDDEIKKAYRRKALELHPDRNYGDTENATRRFAEVQAAYEVLSDPQERAWYDSHRDAILHGRDGSADEPTEFHSVSLTSTDAILSLIRRFDSTVPFTDEPNGFFGIARETFEHLATEEAAAASYAGMEPFDYPTFGSSDDGYEDVVKAFYRGWSGFSTRKSFSWKDKYRTSDAPDRQYRRMMEKENKKLRDEAINEFNDAVRFLVTFVRKRDPRYLPNSQSEADRQKALRDAAATQSARDRAANREKLAEAFVPDWAQSRNDEDGHGVFSGDEEEEEEEEIEHIECVVCNKTFKSDKQYEVHEKSKKHIKAVQQLRRQMKREDRGLDLAESEAEDTQSPTRSQPDLPADNDDNQASHALSVTAVNMVSSPPDSVGGDEGDDGVASVRQKESPIDAASLSEDDDEYAPRDKVEGRLKPTDGSTPQNPAEVEPSFIHEPQDPPLSNGGQQRKVGKAKLKREKKAARQEEDKAGAINNSNVQPHSCTVCHATFPSKNKLFDHIKQLGHAALVQRPAKGGKKTR